MNSVFVQYLEFGRGHNSSTEKYSQEFLRILENSWAAQGKHVFIRYTQD